MAIAKNILVVDWLAHPIKRVCFQVQTWYGLKLNPFEWSWGLYKVKVSPVTMTREGDPFDILTTITYNCTLLYRRQEIINIILTIFLLDEIRLRKSFSRRGNHYHIVK